MTLAQVALLSLDLGTPVTPEGFALHFVTTTRAGLKTPDAL